MKSVNLSLLKRPDALTFDYLTAFTLGPREIGDASFGPVDRPWYVRADNATKSIFTSRANDANDAWEPEVLLFTFEGVDLEEVDIAFEQAGRPVVCAERKSGLAGAKEVWIYWYDPFLASFTFQNFGSGRTPRTLLDNPPDTTRSDIQVFYLKPGVGLVYLQQRDSYAVEIATPHTEETDWYLEDVFYTNNWRVGVVLVRHNPDGSYTKKRMETALMPVYLPPDHMVSSADVLAADMDVTMAYVEVDSDSMTADVSAISGSLVVPFTQLTLDPDNISAGASVQSAELALSKIKHTLYDKDQLAPAATVQSTELAEILIQSSLYDRDSLTTAASILSATLEVV